MEKTWSSLHLVYAWIFALEGVVSTEVTHRALDQALSCYPKCRCILTDDYSSCKRWFRYRWVLTECTGKDIVQEIGWPDSDGGIREAVRYYMNNLAALAIDPTVHIPLKVLLIRTQRRTFFCFIMHHAVADGGGSISFIQKFISCYEDIFYQRKPADHQGSGYEDISLPAIRFRLNHLSPRILIPYLRYCSLFRKQPPVRLYAHELPVDSATFVACVRDLPPLRLESIRTISKQHRATINDYLLASAFRTAEQWRQASALPSGRTYITVPINLRTPEDRTMSNILSSVTVSLTPEAMGEQEALLSLIREQMTALDKNGIARTMLNLSCLLKPVPLALKRYLLKRSFPGFAPTLLLSNLGMLSPNPSHKDEQGFHYMGDARIDNIYVIPNAASWPDLLVSTYNNQIAVTMAVLSSCFSPEAAERFLDSFVESL
jgi:NRPS condensation-like uncharacterized protein